jgi:hypothetical protein
MDAHQAELLFRHKVFRFLKKKGLLSDERIELLLSWKHTGFSIDHSVTVYPTDELGLDFLSLFSTNSEIAFATRWRSEEGILSENQRISSSQHNGASMI